MCVQSLHELTITCCCALTGFELSQQSYVLPAVVCAFTHRLLLEILLFKISTLIYEPHSPCIQPPRWI